MPAQLNAVRHLEHHPKARWVTDNGRIHQRHGIQIDTQQLIQHIPGPLNIIDVQRTDTTRPEHDAEVVVGVSLPERFSRGGVSDVTSGFVPPQALWGFFTWLNGDQGEIESSDVTFCPCGDG
ncbi:hypothetical protein D3C73_783870 [compost metagenome]